MALDRLTQITSSGISSDSTITVSAIAGVITATSASISGNLVGNTASFSGNVSIAGTLTYEDVTNIDSIGVITARSGINVTGIVTATGFVGDVTGDVTGNLTGNVTGNLTGDVNSSGVTTTAQLNVGVGGTVITTTASGNVGVGTENPQRSLHVYGAGISGTNLYVQTPVASNNSAGIKLIPSSGNEYEIQSVVSTTGAYPSSFIVYDRTNDAFRMIIDSSGRVIKPAQPGFFVSGTGTVVDQPTPGEGSVLSTLFTTTSHAGGFNRGGHYNTSTGIFVAPVGGIYYVFANIRWETWQFTQSSHIRTYISVNDDGGFDIHAINGNNEAWNSYFAQNVSGVVALNANDNLRLKGGLNGGTAKLYAAESSWGAYLLG